jgi:GH25 family lysozyme M1 (1,4-beta-N-acetylmuramidase)
MTLQGIDVSAIGQGTFDWNAWRGRISFAGVKVSEDATFADPDAARNVAGARGISAVPMGYHFLHAAVPGDEQAGWFMARCKAAGMERGDLLAVDVEQGGLDGLTPAGLWETAVTVARAIQAHFGVWPVIYTDMSLAGLAPASAAGCPLWLANPSRLPVAGRTGPWKLVSFEQTGQRGVDADIFYGDLSQLARLALPPEAAAPPAAARPTQEQARAALEVLGRYLA